MHNLLRCMVATVLFSCSQWVVSADLVGTVRDTDGRAKGGGIKVTLTIPDSSESSSRETTTTGAGQFAFTDIRPGEYDLKCNGNEVQIIRVEAGINRRDCVWRK